MMQWLLLATGFTGGLTVVFYMRRVYRWFAGTPTIEVHYSPKGGCTEAIVREVNRARREILIQAYSFTSRPIADALIAAKARGVHVEILLDRSNEQETYTELGHLIDKGIVPLIDAQHAIAHNKVMILDRRTVITGSFNFTHQAEAENAENLLILKGHPALARAYHESLLSHKSHCQPATGRPAVHAASRKAA